MTTGQFFPIRLTNLMKVPQTKLEAEELLASFKKTLAELEEEDNNPCAVFRKNMEEGYLYIAALKDATNALTVYTNLYQSMLELTEILEKKNWE
ncbi:hypothetical protein [Leptospira sp. GIMC2001]|uniref:hypothetical protein n=1 Tax=Leptospira sp. GIMC2001 TaxID=1513297 RepID=UPI00234B051A|nr:hypothetical protein [Leptospira sp. GIMC2001]WCL50321.1 hypothetical protein O4O04_05740 [Leptospira sp. GIMC2001]